MSKADWCWVKGHSKASVAALVVSTGEDGRWACSQECFTAGHHVDPRDMSAAYPPPNDSVERAKGPNYMDQFVDDTPLEAALKADAERLAELRAEYDMLRLPAVEIGMRPPAKTTDRIRALQSIIAVYEECATRGRTFGGVG